MDQKKRSRIVTILTYLYLVPLFCCYLAAFLFGWFQTAYMELYQEIEFPIYESDHPLLLLLLGLLVIGSFWFLEQKFHFFSTHSGQLQKIALFTAGVCSLLAVLIYRCNAACDSATVSDIAVAFLSGNYSSFSIDEYLFHYPHQLGLVAFLEGIYYIFGVENFFVFQLLNVAAIVCIVYCLHRITAILFDNQTIQGICSVVTMGLLPLFLYATFVYGDIIGMALSFCGICLVLDYLQTGRKQDIPLTCLLMTFALLLKSNNSILLVAMVITLLLHAFIQKKWPPVLFTLLLILTTQLGSGILTFSYEKAAGLEQIDSGIPKLAWVAMGLQENDSQIENGWYNSYNWTIYGNCNYDTALTNQACLDSIQASLQSFLQHPKSGVRFFYKKFISQWVDPGFQSQITTEWYSRHREDQSPLALSLIYGTGRTVLYHWMNLYEFMIFLGAVWFGIRRWKQIPLSQAFVLLCIFGGFLFHMIWEAQARYVLTYFVLSIPFAACGLYELMMGLRPIRK